MPYSLGVYVICEWAALVILWKLRRRDGPRFTGVLCLGGGGSKSTAAWRRRRLAIARLSLAISQGLALRHLDFGHLQRPVLENWTLYVTPHGLPVSSISVPLGRSSLNSRDGAVPPIVREGARTPHRTRRGASPAHICALYATPPALGVILMDCDFVVTPVYSVSRQRGRGSMTGSQIAGGRRHTHRGK